MSDGIAPRVVAARVLALVVDQGRSLKTELAAALPTLEDVRDRALVEAICFAVLRRRPVYEAALTLWLARPLGRGDAQLRGLLMVGFAQLDVLKVPPYAALSATVDACRVLGWPTGSVLSMRCCVVLSVNVCRSYRLMLLGHVGWQSASVLTGGSRQKQFLMPA